ncbi:hypothetical protein, partial [Pseudomonas aeruginosa]
AALVRDYNFPRSLDPVRGITEVDFLTLATTVVEFRMRCEASVATKSQVVRWLREVLVVSDLVGSVESLAGRTISSLCAQKLIVKIDTGKYRLTDLP